MTKQEQTDRWMTIIATSQKAERVLHELSDLLVGSSDFLEDSIGREVRYSRDSLLALIQVTRKSIKYQGVFDD